MSHTQSSEIHPSPPTARHSSNLRRVSSFDDSEAKDALERIQRLDMARSTPSPPPEQAPKVPWLRSDPSPLLRRVLKPLLVPPVKVPSDYKDEQSLVEQRKTDVYDASAAIPDLTINEREPITSLAISPDRYKAALVGKNIFTIVEVTAESITRQDDIYQGIRSYAAKPGVADGSGKADQKHDFLAKLTIKDIVWPHGSFSRKLIGAATDGRIFLYDLDKDGYEWTRLHQHNRQIHKLSVNPFETALLLSGSQDATVRLWDLRNLRDVPDKQLMQSSACFQGNSDAVRDVQWSPSNMFEFSFGTDGGLVQQWDIRKHSAPLRRIRAHEAPCQSVDYHSDGKHLLSGGADKELKVWDISVPERRIKPKAALRTPYPILYARWRPGHEGVASKARDSWRKIQVATSSGVHDSRVLFWDFRRPFTPIRALEHHDAVSGPLLWRSDHVLWSTATSEAGTGSFQQTNVMHLPDLEGRSMSMPTVTSLEPDGTFWQVFNEALPVILNEPSTAFEELEPSKTGKSGLPGDTRGQQTSSEGKLAERGAKTFLQPTNSGATSEEQPTFTATRPFDVAALSWGKAVKVPGLFLDLSTMSHFLVDLKPLPELPTNATSTEQHGIVERILLDNAEIANDSDRPREAAALLFLAHRVPGEMKKRAMYNRKQRTRGDESAPFTPDDFKPTGPEAIEAQATTVSTMCTNILMQSRVDYGYVLLIWIFINLCPWFPSRVFRFSDENVRNFLIAKFHNHIMNLELYDSACALRRTWSRICPDVDQICGLPSPAQPRFRGGNETCGFCLDRQEATSWYWCSSCGHGGHAECIFKWLETEENVCTVPGCRCSCLA